MITVDEAEKLIQAETRDYGNEIILFNVSLGRALAEDIKADRDLPPFNRVTMDGIAINYKAIEQGIRLFHVKATQAAGDKPIEIDADNECIEIMTGAALPVSVDTIIRYEDLDIRNGFANIIVSISEIKKGQNIHPQGRDKKRGDSVAQSGQIITPAIISLLASVGETEVRVKKLPRVVVISSGDELVDVEQIPTPFQIRSSNNYTIQAILQQHGIDPALLHIPDDHEITKDKIQQCLQNYDVILLSGGISMGKFDYIPKAINELGVQQVFHKVAQRPGKPFWFGKHNNTVIFAFPGNPVAVFMGIYRYFLPWLRTILNLKPVQPLFASLSKAITFLPPLKYFLQVELTLSDNGQLIAKPIEGNGSGDFANLADSNAFLELPLEKDNFIQGEIYRVWPFKPLF